MERVIDIEGVDNARGLGGIPVCGGRNVKTGLFFRGGALAGITERGIEAFVDTFGIARVIDVRCGWERVEKPDVAIPGVENLHIPFYDLEIVGIEYTEPAEGTKVVGRDVACEPSRFYRSLANPLTVGQMRAGVRRAFDSALRGRPVYLHCSGGKDRAGILSLLILTVLGASRADILDDYLLTNVSRDRNYEKTFKRFLRLAGGDEKRAEELTQSHRARPENLEVFYEALSSCYGDMDSFVRNQLSISDEKRAKLREACTE